MRGISRTSVCSQGIPIDYYWWDCPKANNATHISATVDALVHAVKANPSYQWTNQYQEIYVRGLFKSVLDLACKGQLAPIDQVKSVDGAYPAELFEIRWNNIPVSVMANGRQRRDVALLRLFYGETEHVSFMAVGLYAWEKPQYRPRDNERTREEQDAAIEVAEKRYWRGVTTAWGFR